MKASERIKAAHLVSKSLNPSDLKLFVSFLGPAPHGGSKSNFYLPLTMVYGGWCSNSAKPDHQSYFNAHGGNNASSWGPA